MASPSFLLIFLLLILPSSSGFNITKMLSSHPQFSTFNHYLTATHLASEINRRETITVLAFDNTAFSPLLSKHLSLPTLKNLLSLHILVDYFSSKKLHQLSHSSTLSSSLFQSSGSAPSTSGFVNISLHRGGQISFTPTSSSSSSSFVKSLVEIPYNISLIQINKPLSSPEAEAPAAAPPPVNLTSIMTRHGCALFASLLSSDIDTLHIYTASADAGLTVFCPGDDAVKPFLPKFKNLTSDDKASLLLYHGYPVYSSLQGLKSNNGVVTTLATDGGGLRNFNFTVQDDGEKVELETGVNTAVVTSTLVEQDPVAVFQIDRVLEPRELFKQEESPAPEAPAKGRKKKGKRDVEAPVAEPDAAPADLADDDSEGVRNGVQFFAMAVLVLVVGNLVW